MQRIVAIRTDVALPAVGRLVAHKLHRPPAMRAPASHPDAAATCDFPRPVQPGAVFRAGTSDVLTRTPPRTQIQHSRMFCGGSVVEEFYRGFAQRARDLAEKADPFTRRRLLDLAKRYDAKSKPLGSARPSPLPRTSPPATYFARAGEV